MPAAMAPTTVNRGTSGMATSRACAVIMASVCPVASGASGLLVGDRQNP